MRFYPLMEYNSDMIVYLRTLAYKGLCEMFGTMAFQLMGSIAGTTWTNGTILTVVVYMIAKISGAHVNPAVSLSFCLLGFIYPMDFLVYCAFQFAGALLGSLWIKALIPGNMLAICNGCVIPILGLSKFRIFLWEFTATLLFLCPIFAVVWYTDNKFGYGNTGPLIIGLSLYSSATVAAPWTGGSLNPARLIASHLIFNCENSNTYLYYVIGQMIAGLILPLITIPLFSYSKKAWYLKQTPFFSNAQSSSNVPCSKYHHNVQTINE